MNITHTELKKILLKANKEHVPVFIYGAGIVSEVLYHILSDFDIEIEGFCDNNINKTEQPLCGKSIFHTPGLPEKYSHALFLISAADLNDVISQLRGMKYENWYPGSILLKECNLNQYGFNVPFEFVEYAVNTCISCHENLLNPDKLFLRSLDAVITERCSLKCRDCSNLMQYYEKPHDFNIDDVLNSIDAFCEVIDEINEFRVIGGEPFMHKQFHLIIKNLIRQNKVKKVVVYTNGTILPKKHQIEILKHEKVLVLVTDYGFLSRKIGELKELLEDNQIACYVFPAKGWTNCAEIKRHFRDHKGQKDIFNRCCAKNTATLLEGKLYRCPFSANADVLRAIPVSTKDHVDIMTDSAKSKTSQLKKKIKDFLFQKESLETCDFCSGRSFGDPEIPPAVQVNKPIEYTHFF